MTNECVIHGLKSKRVRLNARAIGTQSFQTDDLSVRKGGFDATIQ
jgi:hypothetical protein